MSRILKSHITDFAYQLAKSTPSNIVLDSTNDERLNSFLNGKPVTKWSESKRIAQVRKDPDTEGPQFEVKCVQLAKAHAIARLCDASFVFADLILTPDSYDASRAKQYEVNLSVSDVEDYVAKYTGRTNSDNNFTNAIVMGRALSSWIDWKHFQRDIKDGLTILRDTETGLPVGEYVFRVTFCSLRTEMLRFDNDYEDDHLGDKSQWVFDVNDMKQIMSISDPYTITVALTKSFNHDSAGSVDTKHKGRKEKPVKEQDVPGPQQGR